jgi:hypothetical protein
VDAPDAPATPPVDPHFEDDAFISYAHLDNVELIEGHKGWVTNLHRALEVRVGQLLGKPPHIWRDPKLSGNDLFADTLVERLSRVAILIAVVSPRYLKSDWTMRELTEFWNAAEAQGRVRVRDKARIFKVLKTPVLLERTPPSLRALLGYEFFKVDPDTGKVRELDQVFGPEAQRDFWLKLDDLAHDICALLESLEAGESDGTEAFAHPDVAPTTWPNHGRPPAPSPDVSTGPHTAGRATLGAATGPMSRSAIFLAATTSDLRDQREALARDLQQHGYTVLPTRDLPLVADELDAALRADLATCRMSIHLVGRTFSLVPEGGVHSLIEMQHELATARSEQGTFSRLIWMPEGIDVTDDRQRAMVDRLRLDPRLSGDADFLQTGFEQLRTVVHAWLTADRRPLATPAAVPGDAPRLYLVADERDVASLAPWSEALFAEGLEVIEPVFDGDEAEIREYHQENLVTCDGVLIFYGSGNELWLRRKLGELRKSPGYGRTKPLPVTGVCLIPPGTPEKARFRTHDAMVIPQWDGCDLGALRSLVDQLRAGPLV